MGGGLECVFVCDLCIIEDYVQVVLLEVIVGLLLCVGGMQNLLCLVGEGWVKWMILFGECIDVDIVVCIGLVEEKVGKGEVFVLVLDWVCKVGKQSLISIVVCKMLVQVICIGIYVVVLVVECEVFVDLFDSVDQVEGVSVFLEKCSVQWKNV